MALQLPPIFITLQPALILTTNVLTLAIGPQHRVLQFAFSVPALFILAAQSLYRDWDRGWGLHYGLNCFVMTSLVTWVDWILLNNPYKEQWVKLEQRKGAETLGKETVRATESAEFPKDDGGVVRSKSIFKRDLGKLGMPETFPQRLWWAARLVTTNRYVSWSCEVKNVPGSVPHTYPRWSAPRPRTLLPVAGKLTYPGNSSPASYFASHFSPSSKTQYTHIQRLRRTAPGSIFTRKPLSSRSRDTRLFIDCTGRGCTSP